jgi:hypothetical protein
MLPKHYKDGLPIRSQLLKRVNGTPESHFSMVLLLEDLQRIDDPADIDMSVDLVQRSWASNIYILRITGLHLLHSLAFRIHEKAPERVPEVQQMLEGFHSDNIFESSSVMEALAAFGGLELPVSLDQAMAELRSLIGSTAAEDVNVVETAERCGVTPKQVLRERAYGYVGNVFEDIFQGVYYDAYSQLSKREQRDILCLAAMSLKSGFCTDWILRELMKHEGEEVCSVFRRFASTINTDSFSMQEGVAAFALAIRGCARLSKEPPPYDGGDSAEHLAWRTIGQMLFWLHRSKAGNGNLKPIQSLWARLDGPVALAVADVLYQLTRCGLFVGDDNAIPDLISGFSGELTPVFEDCLVNREALPTLFKFGGGSRERRLIQFVIDTLGKIGTSTTLPILQAVVDDSEFGKDAISAIESIQKAGFALRGRTAM